MAWKIDRDYLDTGEQSAVGTQSLGAELEGETFRFRLRDDDGEIYYGGVADVSAARDDDELEHGGLTEAWQWGMYFAGATDLQVHAADGLKYGLTSRDYLAAAKLNDSTDWVSIFG